MRVIGMISGTSYDAVEAALAEFTLEGETVLCELVEHRSVPYPAEVHDAIAAVLPPARSTVEEICKLDVAVGQFFGRLAKALTDDHGSVDAVCSHGQTVYHWVEADKALGTVQVGEPAWIAEITGLSVVSDVRNRDIAAGGHGAPLASMLDVLLLGSRSPVVRGSLNLGGIANVTVVGPDRDPVAFDIGPSNALMDAAMAWLSRGRDHFDADGALAARGKPDPELVADLKDDPYFRLAPPKSTGKELFNLEYVTSRLRGRHFSPEDLLASLTRATAELTAEALRRLEVADVLVAGGGTRNPTLMAELRRALGDVPIRGIEEFGIPQASKEALVFALIGYLTLEGLPGAVASCTGAGRSAVLGSITPGLRPAPLWVTTAKAAPTRLVMSSGRKASCIRT